MAFYRAVKCEFGEEEYLRLDIYIHITAASRAEKYIARVHACDISYVPEGFSPRRT
jgi:hypothetical protein